MLLVKHLEDTRDAFVGAVSGLSEAQQRFRPAEDAWSIADIVEHLALAEQGIVTIVTTRLPEGNAPSADKVTGPARFTRLDAIVPSREQRRITAPSPLVPKGTFPTVDAALAAFVEARNHGIALAAAGPDVCARVFPHRIFGDLDLEEWLYFCGLHSARHAEQVREWQRAPGYPAE
jgi:hypothetical protein